MRPLLRCALVAPLVAGALAVSGQKVEFKELGIRLERIDARDLQEETTEVPGQGREVPGIDLGEEGRPRHMIGDDPAFAERAFIDSTWRTFSASEDSIVQGATVHWVRYHIYAEEALAGMPLVLNVQANAGFEIFLNGRWLVRSNPVPGSMDGAIAELPDTVPHLSVPVMFTCDGRPEVLAVRIEGAPGRPLSAFALRVTLHAADTTYAMQRSMLHFGVFIGINVIILILALVIWSFDRSDRSWLLLALLSLVSALETVCELGGGMGALGSSHTAARLLDMGNWILRPWPMYLLIMVLGTMRGDLRRRRARLYTAGAIIVTFSGMSFSIAEWAGLADVTNGFSVLDDAVWLLIPILFLGVLYGVIVGWFALEVVRLGIRLLRSQGYARWIGGGAVASSLLTLALNIGSDLTGFGLSSWLAVTADYCSYVAVPVSVAIYLAIRSAHHNRLVARQRDDLDQEVKERTAELSAEKERSDELLLNILPAEVAEELKRTGAAAARHFDQASVLFTDFKGFTSMTEQVGAAELVHELNTCFKGFDDIIGAHGVEKIKTIGDAYMCAGGLPDPRSSSPASVVHAALEMQAFMQRRSSERQAQGQPAFEMRVGIHTGPVVAGIVGVKKFQYDIWGDTVNTASRMESSGEVGKVNISESTYVLVKDEPGLSFTPRGKVQAKGKGELEMYFVRRSGEDA